MIHEAISLDETLAFLNALVKVDADAVTALIDARVPCNDDLSDHPTVQCGEGKVGMLGIFNGLFGTYDDGPKKMYGPITAVLDQGKITRFERTVARS